MKPIPMTECVEQQCPYANLKQGPIQPGKRLSQSQAQYILAIGINCNHPRGLNKKTVDGSILCPKET